MPLTLLPQLAMESFGADTSTGLIPAPHVLAYYAVFFLFGAFLYQRGITVSKWWAAALPPALLLLFPLTGYLFLSAASVHDEGNDAGATAIWLQFSVVQVAFTWLMCFGLMGLFRWLAATERAWVRYVSDSSYWLYLAHLTLVIAGQWLVLDWAVSVHLKFLVIVVAATILLLVTYQLAVRHTPIGALLNGPRRRRTAVHQAA